jgi:hypothetical protein
MTPGDRGDQRAGIGFLMGVSASRWGWAGSQAAIAGVAMLALNGSAAAASNAAPDLSGWWARNSLFFEPPPSGPGPIENRTRRPNGSSDVTRPVGDYSNPLLKPEAAALLKTRGEMALRGISFPNPHNQCQPEPTPLILADQFGVEIIQTEAEILLIYSHDNKVRHIRMNDSHPAGLTPSWQGDSIGRYDGDTLVIDTVGIKNGPNPAIDWLGTPHSEALHVVERYRLVDADTAKAAVAKAEQYSGFAGRSNPNGVDVDMNYHGKGLQVQFTVEDPGVFTAPWSAQVTYRRGLGMVQEMICAENTREYYTGTITAIPMAAKPDF